MVLRRIPSSIVWKFMRFKKSNEGRGADDSRVFCKLCKGDKEKAGIPYTGSTSNLATHLKSHHYKEYIEVVESIGKKKDDTDFNKNTVKNYFKVNSVVKWSKSSQRWKDLTMAIAKWFVKNTRPAKMVEDEGFVKLMEIVKPEYSMPRQKAITSCIEKLYIEESSRVKEELQEFEFVAKSTDGGSSSNCSSFQETGVHGITKDFEMKYFTLAVHEIKDEHTAKNYRKNTDKVEEEFGVKERVVMTTTDNENKMRAAYKDHERNGCLSHILHSSVTEGISNVPEVQQAVLKQRKIIQKHNKSFVVKYGLQVAQKRLGIKVRPLHQDVATRWGSTRVSTQSILDHEDDKEKEEAQVGGSTVFGEELQGFMNARAINEALRKHKFKKKDKIHDYILTRTNMKRIQNINIFLTKSDLYSTTLGGNKFVTASIVMPVMKSIQTHLMPSEDDPVYIANMKKIILEDFKARVAKNLNFTFLIKATALDPRFKKLRVLDSKAQRENIFQQLMDEARENVTKVNVENKEKPVEKKRKLGLDWIESSDSEDDDTEDDAIKREFESYRAESEISREEEDIMMWWRTNKTLYPSLARLAR